MPVDDRARAVGGVGVDPELPGTDDQSQDLPEPELTLAEHEEQYVANKPGRRDDLRSHVDKVTETAKAAGATDGEPAPGAPPAPPRDANTGRFTREARSQHAQRRQAGAGEVGRIAELTRRLRETEQREAEWKQKYESRGETPPAPTPSRSAPAPVAPESRQRTGGADPREPLPAPKPEDFQTWDEYNDAKIDWKVAEARRQDRVEAERQATAQHLASNWREKVGRAKEAFPDFEQVAFRTETRIPQGSLIDAWILEHKAGAHVLYHLQKNPAELDRIMVLPAFEQVDELSQLALRLNQPPQLPSPPTRGMGVRTGAPVARLVQPGPRPPTPVRTAPMRAADEPPDPDTASMRAHEEYWGGGQSRRRR